MTMSLVQIFRLRDGKIALLRGYFAPDTVAWRSAEIGRVVGRPLGARSAPTGR
ncbi:MAG: hypothetical protein ACRDRM_13010 [Pseudonocardiaceae bacterium]